MNTIKFEYFISEELHNHRLDQALTFLNGEFSRAQIQHWIREGLVQIDDQVTIIPKTKVKTGQKINLFAELATESSNLPQNIPLDIIYADDELIVINKPPNLVVHPGAGNPDQTLVNALLHYDPNLSSLPRSGLIHRLDKDTSGLLVIARQLSSHRYLVEAMQQRQIKRIYQAIVQGSLISGGTIDLAIGRHPQQRIKMSVKTHGGKPAVTHYRILQRFKQHTYVEVELETGRTHQIRVHFAHINHSIVGDPLYGKNIIPKDTPPELQQALKSWHRQALHAHRLALIHPRTGEYMQWEAPIPVDMQELLAVLQAQSI